VPEVLVQLLEYVQQYGTVGAVARQKELPAGLVELRVPGFDGGEVLT
jgi:hypothetical protein